MSMANEEEKKQPLLKGSPCSISAKFEKFNREIIKLYLVEILATTCVVLIPLLNCCLSQTSF